MEWTRRRISSSGLGIVLLGVMIWKYPIIDDLLLHDATTQEAMIEDTLARAFDSDVTVRCLPQEDIDYRTTPFGNDIPGRVQKGVTLPVISLMWLNQSTCDSLTSFAGRPNKAAATETEKRALRTLAHEERHVKLTFDENVAECEAVQTVDTLATAMGATPEVAEQIRIRVATIVLQNADETSPEYAVKDCYDGGPHDLDPHSGGAFPVTPSPNAVINGW